MVIRCESNDDQSDLAKGAIASFFKWRYKTDRSAAICNIAKLHVLVGGQTPHLFFIWEIRKWG